MKDPNYIDMLWGDFRRGLISEAELSRYLIYYMNAQ